MIDMAGFTTANVQAATDASGAALRGLQLIAGDALACAERSLAAQAEAWRRVAEATSADQLLAAQAANGRAALDGLVGEAARASERALKVAGEVAAPIQNRFAVLAEALKAA